MKKIEKKMQSVLNRGERILVSGVPIGYPDIDTTRRIVDIYLDSGIDIVEFSMPSLKPYIDTDIIARANQEALTRESSIDKYFNVLYKIREDHPEEPFYMMAYADIIQQFGVEQFAKMLQEVGVDGVELPDRDDILPDFSSQFDSLLNDADVYRIYIMHHPFDQQYFDHVKDKARGFVLLQSVADEMGKRPKVAMENEAIICEMRDANMDALIILGYGINTPERVQEAVRVGADGVIVGTAMIERISTGDFASLSNFIRSMKAATVPG